MKIAFAHHLSLKYYGGGEKWLISTAKELVKRDHEVEIYCLPFLLEGKPKINPKDFLEDIPYHEGTRHKVDADIVYVTYNPLSWINFQTTKPRITGIHSHAYWQKPHPRYGALPIVASITNRFISYFELRRFSAVHAVSDAYSINHPNVYYIPNFVESDHYKPCEKKEKEFSLIYASRKVWQKGWDIFSLIQQHTDVNCLISGDIPEQEMPNFFSRGHVTIVPARVDTFGLTIIESMLCETPVITSPLLTHQALGLPLWYGGEIVDYIRSINEIHSLWRDDPDYYKLTSEVCRRVSLKYDKKIIMNKLENMFKEVLETANS